MSTLIINPTSRLSTQVLICRGSIISCIMKHCKECGGEFEPKISRQIFCKPSCHIKWWKKHGRQVENRELVQVDPGRFHNTWTMIGRRSVEIPCLYCGTIHTVQFSSLLRGEGWFCNRSHAAKYRRDIGNVVEIPCPACGKLHDVIKDLGTPYCTKCRRSHPWLPGDGQMVAAV